MVNFALEFGPHLFSFSSKNDNSIRGYANRCLFFSKFKGKEIKMKYSFFSVNLYILLKLFN